jgi:hypothetical protein
MQHAEMATDRILAERGVHVVELFDARGFLWVADNIRD